MTSAYLPESIQIINVKNNMRTIGMKDPGPKGPANQGIYSGCLDCRLIALWNAELIRIPWAIYQAMPV